MKDEIYWLGRIKTKWKSQEFLFISNFILREENYGWYIYLSIWLSSLIQFR